MAMEREVGFEARFKRRDVRVVFEELYSYLTARPSRSSKRLDTVNMYYEV
jgi:hypothetical protein